MLIKNAKIVLPEGVLDGDILIQDKKIVKIAEEISVQDDTVIDATGLYAFPGLIDMHVHLREPGFEYKEDIESGSKAAVHGGFTQVCCMPNTSPIADNKAVVGYIRRRGEEVNLCKIRPIGAITKGEKGEQLADIGEMQAEGAVAISDDGVSVANTRLMRLAMEYASGFNLKCLCHCEDKSLVDGGVVNEGLNSTLTGLKGIPRAAEDIFIARDICLAQSLNVPVHICHVSTYSGVQLIRNAKASGIQVTAETCPHYYAFTDDIIRDFSTNTKVNPPIREEQDKQALLEGLKDGTIDCIVTDHAPHHENDKNVEYDLAAFGISGIETSFSFAITYLYRTGFMTLSEIAQKMSTNPAKILNLEGGELKEGGVADIMLADIDKQYTVDPDKFYSKGKNTPFAGYSLYGSVEYTIVDGQIKYQA
ncbi:MAG: dihydroorotase [Clostridia bacterium]|nr:dihydroorotase [Clostridia bacterium]